MSSNEVEERAIAVARRLFAAYEARDFAALMQVFARDALIELPFHPLGLTEDRDIRRIRGEQELEQFLVPGLARMKSVKYCIEDISVTNDGARVFVEARGDFLTDEDKPYRNRYVFRLDVVGDRIVRKKEYFNVATATAAFGQWVVDNFEKGGN